MILYLSFEHAYSVTSQLSYIRSTYDSIVHNPYHAVPEFLPGSPGRGQTQEGASFRLLNFITNMIFGHRPVRQNLKSRCCYSCYVT